MPGMQGSELAARLGSTHPETRVLFMSGYPQPMLGPKGAVGLDLDLLDKPFTEAILVGRVQQALAKRLKSDIRQGT